MKQDNAQTSTELYLRLLTWILPYKIWFLLAITGFVIFASAQPMLGYILKFFIDGLNDPNIEIDGSVKIFFEFFGIEHIKLINTVPIIIVLICIWQGLGSFVGQFFMSKVSLFLVKDLRDALFKKMLVLPNSFYDESHSGHLISKITYDVVMVTGAATDAIKVLIREGLTVVFVFAFLLFMNFKLTLILVAALPIMGVMVIFAGKKFRKHSRRIAYSMGELTDITNETIQNYKVIKTFSGINTEINKFTSKNLENTLNQLKLVKTGAIYTPIMQLVIYITMALVMFLVLSFRDNSTAGELVAYITLAGFLPKPIKQLSDISGTIQKGLAGADNIFKQLDTQSEPDFGNIEVSSMQGDIVFKNVNFSYNKAEQLTLNNVSFEAYKGQSIALVGLSGSGKTTLVNLLNRFYTIDSGSISIDGVNINDYSLHNLRQNIALVSQDVSLFNDTVFNNIAYGDLQNTTFADVKKAAHAAYALDFIENLPNGFNTVIGEKGTLLSGGQKQRIAIARAILKNASIILLDEATSALDTNAEMHIQDALNDLMKNRTSIIIAHRLSTIVNADLILVMENGKIIEQGKHQELFNKNGRYANLCKHQFNLEG